MNITGRFAELAKEDGIVIVYKKFMSSSNTLNITR